MEQFLTKETLQLISVIAGGFVGAFFAFVFFQLSEIIKSYHKRKTKHFQALSQLQLVLNDYINKSDKNLQTIHSSNELYKTQKEFLLNYNKLYKYNFDDSFQSLLDLSNQGFVNEIFKFRLLVNRIDTIIEAIDSFSLDLRQQVLSNSLSNDEYQERTTSYLKYLFGAKPHIIEAHELLPKLFATIRVLLKETKKCWILRTSYKKYPKDLERLKIATVEKLKVEIQESKQKSTENIKLKFPDEKL